MSLFEFVTVMISMILALALGQLLKTVSYLARSHRQIIRCRPYSLWLTTLGLTVINHWWSLWDLRVIDWNYASFLYVLIAPTLVTFAVDLFMPDKAGDGPIDLRAQYERVRPLFARVFFVYVLVMWFDGPLLSDQDAFGPVGLLHLPQLAGVSLSLFSDRERPNIVAPLTVITILLTIMVVRFLA